MPSSKLLAAGYGEKLNLREARDSLKFKGWGMSKRAKIFKAGLSVTEEPELSPAFEVYLAGCNLSCGFCTTRSDWEREVPVAEAGAELKRLERKGGLINSGSELWLMVNYNLRIPAFRLSRFR